MTDQIDLDVRPVHVQELLGAMGKQYFTPDFQRPYEWGNAELRELWRDLQNASTRERPHFLGQIILMQRSSDSEKLQIIDGQQRLTTLSILICALRDHYESVGDQNKSRQLNRMLSVSDKSDGEEKRRLTLLNNGTDDNSYESLYRSNIEDATGQVRNSYDFFDSKLNSRSESEIDKIRETLLTDLQMSRLETTDLTSAFEMFQTTNGRGLDLSPIHLVKSMMFEQAAQSPRTDPETVKEKWLDMIDLLDPTDRRVGARRALNHIVGLSDYNTVTNMNAKQFVSSIQDILRTQLPDRSETVGDFMDFLSQEAKVYFDAVMPDQSLSFGTNTKRIRTLTRRVQHKNPHAGVILYFINKTSDQKQEMVNALDLAAKLNYRMNLANARTVKHRDAMFLAVRGTEDGNVADELKRVINRETPTDNALVETVADRDFKNNRVTQTVLLELEREHFSTNHRSMTIGDFQIEHIAPRKAFSEDQYTTWRSEFDRDADKFENYKERLGNITPLASRQNARAGTNPLKDKKPEYRQSEFVMTQQLTEYDGWGYDAIESRSKELAKLVVQTWSIGSMS
jgi:hypothetical protein